MKDKYMQKILMVAEKNSFFVISMSEQLKAVGYDKKEPRHYS